MATDGEPASQTPDPRGCTRLNVLLNPTYRLNFGGDRP